MWIKVEALLCCIIATSLAAKEARTNNNNNNNKKDDPRGKRNLEYSIAHHLSVPSYRAERRISTGPQIQIPHSPYYPLFFPVQQPYPSFRRERLTIPAPPYAVQMEPLVHYSQRDPLYDANAVSFIGSNDIKTNKDDLLREHSHNSRSLYGAPEPAKQVIERPVYIKEPEPIIEIIIKESNITLPPLPSPPVTVAPKKKEQVQVFYVKYKKNPNAYGKDSVIYDKPIPAISPHIPDEPVQVEPPLPQYEVPVATLPPPPSTTLRAIVKPESETYHADKGIHITFGKQENEQYKRSNDGSKEESAPEPTLSHPQPEARQFTQDRQFPPQSSFIQKRPPGPPPPNFQNGPFTFKTERFPPQFRQFSQPPTNNKPPQPPFGRQFPHNPSISRPPVTFQSQAFPPRGGPPSFPQQLPGPGPQQIAFNQPGAPRPPVPYQPFDKIRPQQPQPSQQSQIQFPRPHTHFPIPQQPQQQLPQAQAHQNFNVQFGNNEHQHLQATQQQFQSNVKQEEVVRQQQFQRHQPQQQLPSVQQPTQFHQPAQFNQQPQLNQQPSFNQPPQLQQHQHQHQQQTQQQHHPQPQHQLQQQPQQQPQFNLNSQQQINHFQQQSQQFPSNFQQQQQQPQFGQSFPQPERIIPPGGELIQSVPRYEQHISIPASVSPNPGQPQALPLHRPQEQKSLISEPIIPSPSLTQKEFTRQIQEQFQNIPNQSIQAQFQNFQQHNFGATNHQAIQQQQVQQPQQQSIFIQPTIAPKTAIQVSTTTYRTPTPTTQAPNPPSTTEGKLTEKDLKDLNIELPDEVPADLREQLLSSGILKNAQISVLDYDKVGDIPLSALPPEQLANFYGAGGGQQIASGSVNVPITVDKDGKSVDDDKNVEEAADDLEMEGAESAVSEVKAEAPVEMKVVHYDPQTEQGQKVQKSYVKEGATQVDPVALDGQQYNQYLPVKVNGAAFPIPDVPELKGRTISSVVVLAPVDFAQGQRKARDVGSSEGAKSSRKIAGEALKTLLKDPTVDNFKTWLEKENQTALDKQAVVLLVTGNNTTPSADKEIFMYDIATKTVSKLSGELSSAFVNAAETNGKQNIEAITASESNIIETRVPYPESSSSIDRNDFEADLDDSASDFVETKIPVIDPIEGDNLSEASEQLESFVDISGMPVQPQDDLSAAASNSDALAKEPQAPAIDDQQYSPYLPVKVDSAAFPVPDVPELKGKTIGSVVVLAPAEISGKVKEGEVNRKIAAEALKILLKTPNAENYKIWLDKEKTTAAEKQAVVLLVIGDSSDKEIFMYDIAAKTVSKLDGDLSSAFVDAAETNAKQNVETIASSPSETVETRIPYRKEGDEQRDLDSSASESLETIASALENHVSISSGYSKTGSNLFSY